MLEAEGVIRKLRPGEKALYSSVLFIRNGKVRKTVDFRMLKSYCNTWTTTSQANVLETLASIPKERDTFSALHLEQGFIQVEFCPGLQVLFALKQIFVHTFTLDCLRL